MASAILALPPEVRHKIWEFTFGDETEYRPQTASSQIQTPFWKIFQRPPECWADRSMPILLVDIQLGRDAQGWLFSGAKAVVFDSYCQFREILARASCWGPVCYVETLSFPYYNNEVLAVAMSMEALEKARCFKERMNKKYPEDMVNIDWDANVKVYIDHCEVELKRKSS